jgi:uncharacterized membrane protein
MQSSNPKIVEAADHLIDIFGIIKLMEGAFLGDIEDIPENCQAIRKKLIKALEALRD